MGFKLAICSLLSALVLIFPRVAFAEFSICNQSFDVVNVAIGQQERGQFRTRGWWKIGPNQCSDVIREPLQTQYIYVFAQDIFGKEMLNGSVPMCIAPDRFIIDGEQDCLIRGFVAVPFIEVDTQDTDRWTLFVTARPE